VPITAARDRTIATDVAVTGTEQLVASLVHSLAWPVVLVVLITAFRTQLVGLITQPLRRLRAGPLELEFELRRAQVEAEVEIPSAARTRSMTLDTDLYDYARRVPQAAVLEAFSRVEQRLRELLFAEHVTVDPDLGATALARVAETAGLITPEAVSAVEGVAVMRNLVAHQRSRAEITVDQALDYLALIDGVLYALSRRPRHHD
jgi:hypothetical protein